MKKIKTIVLSISFAIGLGSLTSAYSGSKYGEYDVNDIFSKHIEYNIGENQKLIFDRYIKYGADQSMKKWDIKKLKSNFSNNGKSQYQIIQEIVAIAYADDILESKASKKGMSVKQYMDYIGKDQKKEWGMMNIELGSSLVNPLLSNESYVKRVNQRTEDAINTYPEDQQKIIRECVKNNSIDINNCIQDLKKSGKIH